MRAWRCSAASVAVLLLAGCATDGGRHAPSPAAAGSVDAATPCGEYVAAWVGRFRGNVAVLDGGVADAREERLQQARARLSRDGVDEASCERPYCIVRPLADGRLDSWCGYRVPDPTGAQLYRWIPYR